MVDLPVTLTLFKPFIRADLLNQPENAHYRTRKSQLLLQ